MSGIEVLALDQHRFAIRSGFSPAVRDACKTTPGMSWDADDRVWVGYDDAIAGALRKLDEKEIRYNADTLNEEVSTTILEANYDSLRHYQAEGVDFLLSHGESGALLAFDMRLGKSATSLRAAAALDKFTVVVCPSHVVGVWARSSNTRQCEIERWWPAAHGELVVLEGTKPDAAMLDGAKIVVIHYDVLHAWAALLAAKLAKEEGTLIVDECHACQKEGTRRTQAVVQLRLQAKNTFFLSGTPMTNRPRDLFAVCNTLTPGRFGDSFFPFGMTFCNGHKKTVGQGISSKIVYDFDGRSNEEELHLRMQHFMLRRTKADVASALPPKTRQVIPIEIPKKNRLHIAPESLRDKQLARRLLDAGADGKLPQALAVLEEHLEQGHKVIAFTHRRSVAEFLATALGAKEHVAEVFHGLVPPKKRDAILDRLRATSSAAVLCATIESASTGIDLSFADVIVFVEFTWEWHELLQAEARVYNFEKMDPILIQYLMAVGTADELVLDVVRRKLEGADKIIGGKNADDGMGSHLLGEKTGEEALAEFCEGLMGYGKKKKVARVTK